MIVPDLGGKRIVITGASKGIGLEIAAHVAKHGANVAICSRSQDQIQAAADEIKQHGTRVFATAADVTRPTEVDGFIEQAADDLGGIDALINNAGGAQPGDFHSLDDAAWYGDFDTKVLSVVRTTRAAYPYLKRSTTPRIVNIGSVYGRYPDPRFFATTVLRAADLALTKAMATQFGADGILVNIVNIGFVETPQWENIRQRVAPDDQPSEFFTRIAAEEVPLLRFGKTSEVAPLIAFLCSDASSYITGASIDVAGGMGKFV